MKLERRITFIIGNEGFSGWKINRLKTLTGFFRSIIILQNITTGKSTDTTNTLKIMSLGCKKNEMCQLWIEGADAELTCMVLTDFINDQFDLVNTSHKRSEDYSNSLIASHLTFQLPFTINYHFESLTDCSGIDKEGILLKLSNIFSHSQAPSLLQALLKREAVSSTGIGNNIALPHIMMPGIDLPSVAVIRLSKPLNWGSNLGDVSHIIALLLPQPPVKNVVVAFTQLSRSLLNPFYCNLLTSSHEPEAIKAILLHIMAQNKTAESLSPFTR